MREEWKAIAWGRLVKARVKAEKCGYRSGTGVAQVWVSTAARGSGGWRDMSGDAMTAEQCRVKEGLYAAEGVYQRWGGSKHVVSGQKHSARCRRYVTWSGMMRRRLSG